MARVALAPNLYQLNLEITNAENNANKAFFEALLAPAFAFRRANGVVVDRQGFLEALKAGGESTDRGGIDSQATISKGFRIFACLFGRQTLYPPELRAPK